MPGFLTLKTVSGCSKLELHFDREKRDVADPCASIFFVSLMRLLFF